MQNHVLTPIYKPVSWSMDPELERDAVDPELQAELAARITDALRGDAEAMAAANVPVRRNIVAEEMGDEYVEGLDFNKLLFIAAMLQS